MTHIALILAVCTIALWSFQSYLGVSLRHVPPFFLVGTGLIVSGLVGSFKIRSWSVPWTTFLIGVGGIFGYNLLLFSSLQYAPPIEASLVNYLWPLLIVILSPLFLRQYQLRWYHLVGAVTGFFGAALIIIGDRFEPDWSNLQGYLLAAGAALLWAVYSLLTKKVRPFSTGAVGCFCFVSGLLSLLIHFVFEPPYLPTTHDWELLFLLGTGPLGLAYYTWDGAIKKGDPRVIGSLCYLTPLTSTLVLVFFGGYAMQWVTLVAMVLIVAGALLGSLDLILPQRR